MASAVLASQNEREYWTQSSYMAKLPYPVNPNPNSNPNSFSKKKHHHRPAAAADSPAAVTQASSDDAYSFNQRPIEQNGNTDFNFNPGPYISFDISNNSKSELTRIRNQLVAELESVRRLNSQIESGKFISKKKKRPNPNPVASAQNSKKLCQKLPVLNPAEMENLMKMCKQVLGKLLKHKLSWVFNKPVDAAALGLHDYHQIVRHPMDLGTVKSNLAKNLYSSPADFAADVRLTFNNALLYNPQGDEVHMMADQLLSRFEEFYSPIREKYKIENIEIDELQGSSRNVSPIPEKPKKSKSKPKPLAVPMPMPVPPPKKREKVEALPKKSEKMETISKKIESLPIVEMVPNPPPSPPPLPPPSPPMQQQLPPVKATAGRGSAAKLPKPRAKDPNKRAMSMEEKHKLSIGLQSLPQEKMTQLVHIIKKRNAHMVQDGDEIELDIEAIDTETLWELDRFVMNWKKMVSKSKRQALISNPNSGSAPAEMETASGEDNVVSASERIEVENKEREEEGGEDDVDMGDDVGDDVGIGDVDVGDDVDIGDDVPMSSFPPVEIDKDDGGGGGNENINNNNNNNNNIGRAASSSSSSSGSSSSDSSSSDSDSGSSSGSDSDADDAQSKGLGDVDSSKQKLDE